MLLKTRKLERLSGQLFALALLLSQLGKLKNPIISSLCFVASSALYLTGYIAWKLSVDEVSRLKSQPNNVTRDALNKYYIHNFQNNCASVFGIFASIATLAMLIHPLSMGLLSSWLFFGSNIFWLWGEANSLTHMEKEALSDSFLSGKHAYYRYATISTLMSGITCFTLSLSVIFPAIALPLSAALYTHIIALNIFSLQDYIKAQYIAQNVPNPYQKALDKTIETSHKKIIKSTFCKSVGDDDYKPINSNATITEGLVTKKTKTLSPNLVDLAEDSRILQPSL